MTTSGSGKRAIDLDAAKGVLKWDSNRRNARQALDRPTNKSRYSLLKSEDVSRSGEVLRAEVISDQLAFCRGGSTSQGNDILGHRFDRLSGDMRLTMQNPTHGNKDHIANASLMSF